MDRKYSEYKSSEDDDDADDYEEDYKVSSTNNGGNTTNNNKQSLTQLEQDIMAKTHARGSTTTVASRPGVTSVGASALSAGADERTSQSNLSQIERDILAKQMARGGGGSVVAAARPGVVSVATAGGAKKAPPSEDISSLSQLERDILSKRQAAAASASGTSSGASVSSAATGTCNTTSGLSQLERDVVAKQNARGQQVPAMKPGAFSTTTAATTSSAAAGVSPDDNNSTLSQLERDILSKQAARGGATAPASRPGVVMSSSSSGPVAASASVASGGGNLSQMEQDVLAKQNARGGTAAVAASRPGVISSTAAAGPDSSNLSQLERDVMAKRSIATPSPATVPGVMKVSAASATAPAMDGGNDNLSQLERDVMAKTNARGNNTSAATRPGVVPSTTGAASSSVPNSNLSNLERDILAKQVARGGGTGETVVGVALAASTSSNNSNLTQLERDVLIKQGARNAMAASPATVPGVVPHNVSTVDRDASMTKPPARANNIPAAANDRTASDHLSSLERDVISKQQARGASPAMVPGVVSSAGGSNNASAAEADLSQLERDVLLKANIAAARGGPGSGSDHGTSAASNLSRLEQDVASKLRASSNTGERASQPGIVRTSGTNDSPSTALNQLESDITAKARAAGSGARASAPGVVASPALSQLERDIEAKISGTNNINNNNNEGGSMPAASMAGIATGLSQLEQDIVSKGRAGPNVASHPGAVAASNLSQLEQDIAAKTGSTMKHAPEYPPYNPAGTGSAAAAGSSMLNQMENDIRAKNEARGSTGRAMAPGIVPEGASALDRFENDIASKQAARPMEPAMAPGVARTSINQFEENILAKQRAADPYGNMNNNTFNAPSAHSAGGTGARAALTQLELDAAAKLNARGSGGMDTSMNAAATLSHLEQFEANMVRDNRVIGSSHGYNNMGVNYGMYDNNLPYTNNSMYEPQQQQPVYGNYDSINMSGQAAAMARSAPPFTQEPDYQPEFVVDSAPSSSQTPPAPPDAAVTASVAVADPEAPLYPGANIEADADAAGIEIEAFVADNVVDATGVAVIMSDEEEAMMEKRRQRRLFGIGCCCVIIVLIAVIVPLSQRSGGAAPPPEIAPTFAPTSAPTLAPTSDGIPKAVVTLQKYSTLASLQDRRSPQFLSMDWLTNNDTYVIQNGLTYESPKWIQRYIMGIFYFQFQGDLWITCNRNDDVCDSGDEISSWMSSKDECTWWLLGCEGGVLTKMNFVQNAPDAYHDKSTILDGPFPEEIKFLTGLKQFVLPGFALKGEVLPLFSNMTNLSIVDLSQNKFSGSFPANFPVEHPYLQSLELSSNSFAGPIPSSLGTLESLMSLSLNANMFQGSIPTELANLKKLTSLDLSGNKLIDGVPLSLYNQRLEVLKVGGNVDVTGTIPSIISNMTSLRVFDVGQTKFGGPIPTGIYSLPNITTLDLGQAAFTGGISELIGKTNKTLVDLFLDGNLLTGPLPASFSALGKLENLFLANNSLTGSIPETGLCERRGLGGGNLQQITRDCNIVCGCCPEKCVD